MAIINLHKRNKPRKIPQPKKAPKSPKSDKPEKSLKSSDEKKTATKTGKKQLERPHSLREQQSHLNLIKQMTQVMMTNRSLKNHQSQTMKKRPHSLKKHQSHLSLLMTQERKTRSLKKGQAMEKRPLQKKAPGMGTIFFKGVSLIK